MSGSGSLPFGRIELMDDPEHRGAAMNMALDEVLLDRLSEVPLLRIYRWRHASVSMGCFELSAPIAKQWANHDLVRRWTGGGVVEHGRDLTFSLLVPRSMTLATLPVAESYRIIHEAVGMAMIQAGLPTPSLQMVSGVAEISSRACFDRPVRYDLLSLGQKIVGGAQRRTRRGLLHQGSIQTGDEAGIPTNLTARFAMLAADLPLAIGSQITSRSVSADDLKSAGTLASAKYGNPAWLNRY